MSCCSREGQAGVAEAVVRIGPLVFGPDPLLHEEARTILGLRKHHHGGTLSGTAGRGGNGVRPSETRRGFL